MTFSRIEPTHREPLDLNRVLEVAIGIAHSEIRTRAKLVRNFKPLPLVDGNAAQLGQVFVNLLLNAAQAIPPGHHTDHEITVTTHVDAANNAVIEVRDTGRGIPRGVAAKVFEAFVTTKPAGAGPGLGPLGRAQPRPRRRWRHPLRERAGPTVFRVVLPSSERTPVGGAVAPSSLGVARSRSSRPRVDRRRRADLRELVAPPARPRARCRRSRTTARKRSRGFAAGERYDAIVSDLMMPGMGGVELFTKRVRARDRTGAALHLRQRRVDRVRPSSLARITNPWFDKPCDLDALRAAIRRLVG